MICIVDDDAVVHDSMRWLCESRGLKLRAFFGGQDFLHALESDLELAHAPICLLLDVRMPEMSGLELFDLLLAQKLVPPITVIFQTGHGDVPMAVEMLKKGAFDFVEKPFSDNQLVDRLIEGEARSQKRLDEGVSRASNAERIASLSAREREVMNLILQGKLNKTIADELGISMRTVEVHRARVFSKMGVKSAVDLAQLAASIK